jgi:hypothetical protein
MITASCWAAVHFGRSFALQQSIIVEEWFVEEILDLNLVRI